MNTRTHRFPVGDGAAEQVLDRVDVVPSGARLRVVVPERRLLRTPACAVRVIVPPATAARVAVASADVELRGELGRVELTGAGGDARIGTVRGRATPR